MSDTPPKAAGTADELGYDRAMDAKPLGFEHLDVDAFADGIIAHRQGIQFHENPRRETYRSLWRLSWDYGWNQRALRQP